MTKDNLAINERKKRLLKDIVIPAGTIFTERFGRTLYYMDNFQASIGLTKNTSGTITYGIDNLEEMKEWFEDL